MFGDDMTRRDCHLKANKYRYNMQSGKKTIYPITLFKFTALNLR